MVSSSAERREHPIIFTEPMVRAILAGSKTQTRRVVKGWPLGWLAEFTPEFVAATGNRACPHGAPGDRLWVRETFRISGHEDCARPIADCATRDHCHYRADLDEPPVAFEGCCRWILAGYNELGQPVYEREWGIVRVRPRRKARA